MRILIISILVVLFSHCCLSQFTDDVYLNTPICTEFGKQNDPRIIGDGHGGAFIAWKDSRNGTSNPDIYLQHIDSLGYSLWSNSGIVICDDLADQSTPNLCSDMNGGVIIVWSDLRNGIERDIYAQRVSSNGAVLWTQNGVPVANKLIREHNEKICSDGLGGAYIVWEQYDDLIGHWDISIQHINSNGDRLWNTDGVAVSNFNSNRLNPKIQKGKFGGAYLVWQDLRNGLDYDVCAQRMDISGNLLWGQDGITVSGFVNSQINPKIDSDSISGGIYVAWADKRNGIDYDIYAQRIDSTGNAIWNEGGLSIAQMNGNQSAVDILSTSSSNGVILTWRDGRNNFDAIYSDKISPAGISLWQVNGLLLSNENSNKLNPNICSDGNGGAIVTWQDSTINDWDVFSQKLNSNGQIQWQSAGIVVSSAIEIQSHPKNIPDGSGGSIFVWQDKRANQYDIYCHHLNYAGIGNYTLSGDIFEFSLFPNPTKGFVQVQSSYDVYNLRVYNMFGEIIMATSESKFSKGIDFSSFAAGIYIVELDGGRDKIRSQLIKI